RWTIYHAGDSRAYPELAQHLMPFNVSVALLPLGPDNFTPAEAAQLAADIGASWVAPMHYGTFDSSNENDFVNHMLGHRPSQRFHIFQIARKWTVPEE